MDPRNKEHIDAEVEKKHSDRKSAFEIDFFFQFYNPTVQENTLLGKLKFSLSCKMQRAALACSASQFLSTHVPDARKQIRDI